MPRDEFANYSVSERLRNGQQVVIRAVRPDDRGLMVEALRAVSSESFYRRVFSPKRDLSDDELKRLTDVDFRNVVALVAVMNDGPQEKIVGGGRYVRTEASASESKAEVALLIDDVYQGLGIGSRIFKHLVSIARAAGIAQFEAEVLPSNERMLRLFDGSGLPLTKTVTRDSVHVTIELQAAEATGNTGKTQAA